LRPALADRREQCSTFIAPCEQRARAIDNEHAKSSLDGGVLTLVIPKTAAAQTKTIEIKTGPKS
jgi:hypothetical protein